MKVALVHLIAYLVVVKSYQCFERLYRSVPFPKHLYLQEGLGCKVRLRLYFKKPTVKINKQKDEKVS